LIPRLQFNRLNRNAYCILECYCRNGENLMTTTIKPLEGKVLLKKIIKEQKVGSLVIPDSANQETQFYEVVAIGPIGKDNIHFAVGNQVILARHAALPILLDKSEFFIVRVEDIIATVIKSH